MNMLSRVLRKLRIKSFPSGVEGSLVALTPEERATALIHAVNYCIKLRRDSPDTGTMISMTLLQPGNLSSEECESLYFNLEGLCLQMKVARISDPEYEAVLSRHGKKFADNYRKMRHSLPHIRVAAERHSQISSLTTPGNGWSKETPDLREKPRRPMNSNVGRSEAPRRQLF